MWFVWIVGTLFWQLYRAPKQEFWRLCLPLFAGMTLSLMFCAVVPNGVNLRPAAIQGNDIFTQLVRGLWSADTSTNVCPSIHVFNSITLDLAFQRSSLLHGRRGQVVRWAAHLLDVAVVLSTMMLKQHSVIDVVCGILLAVALDRGGVGGGCPSGPPSCGPVGCRTAACRAGTRITAAFLYALSASGRKGFFVGEKSGKPSFRCCNFVLYLWMENLPQTGFFCRKCCAGNGGPTQRSTVSGGN